MSDNLAAFLFHQGTNFSAYNYFGVNMTRNKNTYIYAFRTWAPNANSVALVSDFLGWDNPREMKKITDNGIYELIIESPVSYEKSKYKFQIRCGNKVFFKADPYAKFSIGGDDGASIIFTENDFTWTDANWLKYRKKTMKNKNGIYLPTPINIYELHLGSFLRKDDNSYLSYTELAEVLPYYVKSMGYTHVEFLPVAEHPYDGSWGYQICAFFAPTSRFGTPSDFKHLINSLHSAGIGVIIDWVGAHFPKDEWGLYEFDGAPLYEYQGLDRQESETWGTRFFDLGREEIQSFLISNALYFLREFHIDGLRVDAVASMLYLDYDKEPGKWIPNSYGGKENLEAVAFFKKLSSAIALEFKDVLLIAEESGTYKGITKPVSDGGLGFNLKWNMGFANDFFDYMMTDPIFRKHRHKALNFPIMYAFNENYILPISHDEVVHGKLSFINKMHGSYEDKFRQMRTALLLMMTYPGKKMTFMGTEFAQFREWDYANSLEWFMLDFPSHYEMREYIRALNMFYLSHKELYEIDFSERGFKWIFPDLNEENSVVYRRRSISGKELIIILNLSGSSQTYKIPTRKYDCLKVEFTSELYCEKEYEIYKENKKFYANITLPSYFGMILSEARREKILNL